MVEKVKGIDSRSPFAARDFPGTINRAGHARCWDIKRLRRPASFRRGFLRRLIKEASAIREGKLRRPASADWSALSLNNIEDGAEYYTPPSYKHFLQPQARFLLRFLHFSSSVYLGGVYSRRNDGD